MRGSLAFSRFAIQTSSREKKISGLAYCATEIISSKQSRATDE